MKKRLRFPAILCIMALCGCAPLPAPAANEALLYYPAGQRTGTRSEPLETETLILAGTPELWPEQALRRLVRPPSDELLTALFPDGVTLVSLSLDLGWADVLLSAEYAQVEGLDKTLCEAAVTLTLCQFDGVDAVTIRADVPNAEASPMRSASDYLLGGT
jgi:germination protein M